MNISFEIEISNYVFDFRLLFIFYGKLGFEINFRNIDNFRIFVFIHISKKRLLRMSMIFRILI